MNVTTETVKESIVNMSLLVKKGLGLALDENVSKKDLFEIEDEVNLYHRNNDDIIFKFIALKNPMAKDLRFVLASMKMNTDLERIGDWIININRSFRRNASANKALFDMLEEVQWMFSNCVDAYINENLSLAFDVIDHDKVVNEQNRTIIQRYIDRSSELGDDFEQRLNTIQMAKGLERIGDHCKNIAEDIIFLEKGEDIRHHKVSFKEVSSKN